MSAARKLWNKTKQGGMPTLFLVGVRGYYLNSMGDPNSNDRGIYDDAIFIVGPNSFASFNANVDPSVKRKGVACLCNGIHPYRRGKHGITKPDGGYPALRPATKDEALMVTRDGIGKDLGYAINIHKGSFNSTSSLGCQTIYPAQWDAFISLVYSEMARESAKVIDYFLIDGPIN